MIAWRSLKRLGARFGAPAVSFSGALGGGGGFAQRVHTAAAVAQAGNGEVALVREASAPGEAAAGTLVAADASRGFELLGALGGGGVLRCALVRVAAAAADEGAARRHLLLLNVHHVAFDGASTGVVLGEVLASQAGVHGCWGGVVPRLAQEAHRAAIDATVEEALRRVGVHWVRVLRNGFACNRFEICAPALAAQGRLATLCPTRAPDGLGLPRAVATLSL